MNSDRQADKQTDRYTQTQIDRKTKTDRQIQEHMDI